MVAKHNYMRYKTLEDRYWSKVDKKGPNECWPWNGAKHERGYGQFFVGSTIKEAHKKKGSMHPATWVSLYLADGIWDKNCVVMHSCDNPNCVNPAHLLRGSHKDNMKDRDNKGRNKPRVRIPLATHSAIKNAPSILRNDEIAMLLGVSSPHVSRVRRGLTRNYEGQG